MNTKDESQNAERSLCFWCRSPREDEEKISCKKCDKVRGKRITTGTYKLPGNP